MHGKPFLTISNATIRFLEKILFNDLSFEIKQKEHWAIIGPNGSGKSTLLKAIAGRHNILIGQVKYHFYDDFIQQHPENREGFNFRHLVALIGQHHQFRNRANIADFFYQQRYQASFADDTQTVREYLNKILALERAFQLPEIFGYDWIVRQLKLLSLLDRSLIKLSNGETRRLLIAAALLNQPHLLLLDNPFAGLDVDTRPFLRQLIDDIADRGIQIIMVTTQEEMPSCISHVLLINEHDETETFTKTEFENADLQTNRSDNIKIDNKTLEKIHIPDGAAYHFKLAVKFDAATVKYGDQLILDQVNWEIHKGEKWALVGHNGAGKTTLLSLINGDNPQAYANKITLFDHRRGSGESIWDIKKRIGFMSPELHQYFRSGEDCLHVVISGFFDAIGAHRKFSADQQDHARLWFDLLSVSHLENLPFKHCSAGEQRLVLLARALVKDPPLLILDEPCQALDNLQKHHFTSIVNQLYQSQEKTLIYVSHYADEIPSCVNRVLKLSEGKVIDYQ